MNTLEHNEKAALENLVYSAAVFTQKDRQWHLEQIKNGETDTEKIEFYIWAADQRAEILSSVPKEKREQISEIIEKLLDQHAGTNREKVKGSSLEEMKEAVLLFRRNQDLVKTKTQKLRNLPPGFETRIWERFMDRFETETSGDVLDPVLMANFRKSIDTTFNHLAKVLEMQDKVKQKLSSEKYFSLKSNESSDTERARLSGILQTQIFNWLGQDTRLKEWEKGLTNLLNKQLPKNLKEFKEHYSGVFSKEFWKNLSATNPMELPNFTVEFNFQTEDDFLTKMSLKDIKSLPKKLKKTLLNDSIEILSEFFSADENKKELSDLNSISEKNPAKLLKKVSNLRKTQNRNRDNSKKNLSRIKQLYFDKDTKTASAELDLFRKKYGKNVLHSLMEDRFESMVDLRLMRIKSLEKQLKVTSDTKKKKHIQDQLAELCIKRKNHCDLDMSAAERKTRVFTIEKEVKSARVSGDLQGAKAKAKTLRGLNDVKAELLISEINREIEKRNEKDLDNDGENKVNTSVEKQKKIEFFEKALDHAKGVKEACSQIGIPTDDPKFWKNEGLKNRVGWLKDHGFYETYQKFNSSDPNIPSNAQNGFRFRWMDGVGDNLNYGGAEKGIQYLQRYKESGYILAALAGAFSISWKNADSPTYTPDEFMTKITEQMNKVKGTSAK